MILKYIDISHHMQMLPNKYSIGKYLIKLRIPVLTLIALLIIPEFLAQSGTNFIYGMGELPENTRAGQDTLKIEDTFGKFTPIVLLVPKGDLAREEELVDNFNDLNEVKSVIAYTNSIGAAIPPEYLDEEVTEPFFSENYSRIVLNTTTDEEGQEAFSLVKKVRELTHKYYGDDFHATGGSVNLYAMKQVVEMDKKLD